MYKMVDFTSEWLPLFQSQSPHLFPGPLDNDSLAIVTDRFRLKVKIAIRIGNDGKRYERLAKVRDFFASAKADRQGVRAQVNIFDFGIVLHTSGCL
jgi:hypothetical protein